MTNHLLEAKKNQPPTIHHHHQRRRFKLQFTFLSIVGINHRILDNDTAGPQRTLLTVGNLVIFRVSLTKVCHCQFIGRCNLLPASLDEGAITWTLRTHLMRMVRYTRGWRQSPSPRVTDSSMPSFPHFLACRLHHLILDGVEEFLGV